MAKPKGGKQIQEAAPAGVKEKATRMIVTTDQAFPAQVMEIVGSMGTREGGRQARVKVLAGPDSGKIIRRNVIGPVKIGDILMLRETEFEASPLKGRKR
jgi:small subunit ribosomal protein S28e